MYICNKPSSSGAYSFQILEIVFDITILLTDALSKLAVVVKNYFLNSFNHDILFLPIPSSS